MVADSLAGAIATVAEREYRRLSQGKNPEERRDCVTNALKELKKLSEGEDPEYNDEWDALFSLT